MRVQKGHGIIPLMGRPSSFSQAAADEICERIAAGETVRNLSGDNLPEPRTIFRWLASNESFRQQYARAKESQAEVLAEEILEISDDATNDYTETEDGAILNHENIQRSRLRVDSRKWLLSKLLPKKYGDRVQQEINGGEPLRIVVTGIPPTPENT